MTNHLFELAGNRKTETVIPKSKKKWYQGKPVVSAAILILIVLGCLCAELIMTKDPAYMDLLNYNKAPDREFLFGTVQGCAVPHVSVLPCSVHSATINRYSGFVSIP